jgi:hypothetical protein
METPFNIARFTAIAYQFNPETGYYEKAAKQPAPMPCNAMPYELRRERTMADQIKGNATEILTVKGYKKENGSKKILTGLQPAYFDNWYIGNHYNPRAKGQRKSDILFYFHPDHDRMTAFFFSGFHKNTKELRDEYYRRAIPQLKNDFNL